MESGQSEKSEEVQQKCSAVDGALASGAKGNEGESAESIDVSSIVRETVDKARAVVLAAEVRRLRKLFDDAGQGEHNVLALVEHYQSSAIAAEDEVRRLREKRDLFREAGHAAELRIVELREENARLKADLEFAAKQSDLWQQQWTEMRDTMWKPAMAKLARVEALPKYWRDTSGDRSRAWECAENLEAALKDE